MRTFYIGRNPENDIVVNDPVVSGRHAEISVDDVNRVVFTDYSTNGTYINGRLIRHGSCDISINDQIVFPSGAQLNWNDFPGIFGPAANAGTQYAMPGAQGGYSGNARPGMPPTNMPVNNGQGAGYSYNSQAGPTSMGMGAAIKTCFSKYATFSGRARRSEFWFWALFNFLMTLIPFVGWFIWPLVAFLPSLAVTVRRLHDTGKSGLLLLLFLIPFVNFILVIVFFVFYCMDSAPGDNQYGPNPKYS